VAFFALILLKSAPPSTVTFQTIEVSLVVDETDSPAQSTPSTPSRGAASADHEDPIISGRASRQMSGAPPGRRTFTAADWSPRFNFRTMPAVSNLPVLAAALECLAFPSRAASPSRPGRPTCALNEFEFARRPTSPWFAPPPGTHFTEPEAAVDYRVLLAPLRPDLSPFRDNPLPDKLSPGAKALESSLRPDQILR
jgi:hypothetical protein